MDRQKRYSVLRACMRCVRQEQQLLPAAGMRAARIRNGAKTCSAAKPKT